jgi:hypothetical protein
MDIYAPVKGKCMWWREFADEEDRFDQRLSPGRRRVSCVCFVEGDRWQYLSQDVPADCPLGRRCRYHIKA